MIFSCPVWAATPTGQLSSLDNWNMYAWVAVRPNSPTTINSLPQLGGSQAGIRLQRWWGSQDRPAIALTARLSRILALPKGGEGALGIEIRPARYAPISLIIERRIRLDRGGRSDMAAIFVADLSDRALAGGWRWSGYVQTGMVGADGRTPFIDGHATVSRTIGARLPLRVGWGVWTAAQPAVDRIDVGPEMTGKIQAERLAVHWAISARLRVAGNAKPDTGAAFVLATGF